MSNNNQMNSVEYSVVVTPVVGAAGERTWLRIIASSELGAANLAAGTARRGGWGMPLRVRVYPAGTGSTLGAPLLDATLWAIAENSSDVTAADAWHEGFERAWTAAHSLPKRGVASRAWWDGFAFGAKGRTGGVAMTGDATGKQYPRATCETCKGGASENYQGDCPTCMKPRPPYVPPDAPFCWSVDGRGDEVAMWVEDDCVRIHNLSASLWDDAHGLWQKVRGGSKLW